MSFAWFPRGEMPTTTAFVGDPRLNVFRHRIPQSRDRRGTSTWRRVCRSAAVQDGPKTAFEHRLGKFRGTSFELRGIDQRFDPVKGAQGILQAGFHGLLVEHAATVA